jgi:predicted enzyme related to lactoylglutathione lyase
MSRVVHFEIHASDPPASIAFYTSLFDWKIEKWGKFDYWQIETGPADQPGINGGLLPRKGTTPRETQPCNAFVCTVEVESLDASFAKALSLGATIAVSKKPIPGVGWLAYVKDPDQNIFGLMQPDSTAR